MRLDNHGLAIRLASAGQKFIHRRLATCKESGRMPTEGASIGTQLRQLPHVLERLRIACAASDHGQPDATERSMSGPTCTCLTAHMGAMPDWTTLFGGLDGDLMEAVIGKAQHCVEGSQRWGLSEDLDT